MSKAKEEVTQLLSRLPDDCTLEDIQYHLYVLQQVEKGLTDLEKGNIYTHEQVKERMAKWLKN